MSACPSSFPMARVSRPAGTRESEICSAYGEPVYVTTAVLANGGEGRWCDVDVYLDMIAPLDEHAHAYAAYLQRVHGADVPMRLTETELPAGPAFAIEMLDLERARLRAMYLFDGPVAEDGTIDRFLLTCAAAPDAEPFGGPSPSRQRSSRPPRPSRTRSRKPESRAGDTAPSDPVVRAGRRTAGTGWYRRGAVAPGRKG